MSTKRKADAARRNGAKSRGPITAEGKAASARNAIKHGLTSEVVVLETEDSEAFEQLLAAYTARWQPADQAEADLVQDMAVARWRLYRTCTFETALIDLELKNQQERIDKLYEEIIPSSRAALAFSWLADRKRGLTVLGRNEARLERTLHRAAAELRVLQAERALYDIDLPENENFQNEPTGVQLESNQQPAADENA